MVTGPIGRSRVDLAAQIKKARSFGGYGLSDAAKSI
jgi:hypothetical protein